MESFTPASGLLGGMLIGIASTLLLVANGRIAGISGIVGGVVSPIRSEKSWRVVFVIGLWVGASMVVLVNGAPSSLAGETSLLRMSVAGTLVGFGTRMGGGCTSGHGVCGLARRSRRSAVATALFMATGMITVYLARHVVGG